MTRQELAAELLRGCPAESLKDHQRIASAIERGDSREDILNMTETDNWPETYHWLKEELKDPAAVALGRRGGSVKSSAKAASSAANGKLGGRPRKVKEPAPE